MTSAQPAHAPTPPGNVRRAAIKLVLKSMLWGVIATIVLAATIVVPYAKIFALFVMFFLMDIAEGIAHILSSLGIAFSIPEYAFLPAILAVFFLLFSALAFLHIRYIQPRVLSSWRIANRKKRIAWIAGGIFGSAVLLVIASAALLVYGLPSVGEHEFRRNFEKVQKMYVMLSDPELALNFGGRIGLPRLRRLSQDPTMAPFGQKRAAGLIAYIESGKHVTDLQRELEQVRHNKWPMTPWHYYARFIVWHDKDHVVPARH